jgi:hypothetical protein
VNNLIFWSVVSEPDLYFSWDPEKSHFLWVTFPDGSTKGTMLSENGYHLEQVATGTVVVFDKFYIETAIKVSIREAGIYRNRCRLIRRWNNKADIAKCGQIISAITDLDVKEAEARVALFVGDALTADEGDTLAIALAATIQTTFPERTTHNGTSN